MALLKMCQPNLTFSLHAGSGVGFGCVVTGVTLTGGGIAVGDDTGTVIGTRHAFAGIGLAVLHAGSGVGFVCVVTGVTLTGGGIAVGDDTGAVTAASDVFADFVELIENGFVRACGECQSCCRHQQPKGFFHIMISILSG